MPARSRETCWIPRSSPRRDSHFHSAPHCSESDSPRVQFDVLLSFLRVVLAVCLQWICPFWAWRKPLLFSYLAADYPLVSFHFSAPAQYSPSQTPRSLSLPANLIRAFSHSYCHTFILRSVCPATHNRCHSLVAIPKQFLLTYNRHAIPLSRTTHATPVPRSVCVRCRPPLSAEAPYLRPNVRCSRMTN